MCVAAAPAGTEPERVYALLSDSQPAVLAEVDARTLKPVSSARVELATLGLWSFSPNGKTLAVANRSVVLVSWLTQDTVVAIRQRADRTLELAGVASGKRAIRWRTPLSGVVLAGAAVGGELVLLVGKEGQIVAPRIVVVDARGRMRSAELGRLRAGWSWDLGQTPPVGETTAAARRRSRCFASRDGGRRSLR